MKHLYIATPTYDQTVCTGYMQSMLLTMVACTKAGIAMSGPVTKSGPYIECNRNHLVHLFMRSGADTLLFIDADVTWDEKAVVKLYESGLDVVGGAYPKKEEKENYPVRLLDKTENGYLSAMYLPGGFLMIRRKVFEMMKTSVVKYHDEALDEEMYVYFQNMHTNDQGFCGEDVYFSCMWRTLGGTVWLAPNINFGHQGQKVWAGNYADHCLEQSEDGTRRAA